MRVVLYAHDMEPITILELNRWQFEFLQKHGDVMLAVQPALAPRPDEALRPTSDWSVRITAEKLHRNGDVHMMLFTHDEEQALLLKAAFLPGQRHALREHERQAFAKGFLSALERLGE